MRLFPTSLIHAVPVSLLHLWLIAFGEVDGWWSDRLYAVSFGFSFGYAVSDFCFLKGYCGGNQKLWRAMCFHHALMVVIELMGYYTYFYNPRHFPRLISLGHLSELTTPLLNVIQLLNYQVRWYWLALFAVMYFWLRPLNFLYLSWEGYCYYGWFSIFNLVCYVMFLLNSYWFFLILRKGYRLFWR